MSRGLQYNPPEDQCQRYRTAKMDPRLQNVRQSPSRLDAAREGFEAAGVKMKEFYMVTGQYDMIAHFRRS